MLRDDLTRTLTLLLVRHGETQWNAERRWQGQHDIPLSANGREQALLLSRRLQIAWANGHLPGPPSTLFTSDLSRSVDTARVLQDALPAPLPIRQLPDLRERHFGSWEGLTEAEVQAQFGSIPSAPDGESYEAVWHRMNMALNTIWHDSLTGDNRSEATALVVGHGGSLRMLLARALGCGVEEARRFRLGNTSVSIVVFRGIDAPGADGYLLLANDTAHLDLPPQTAGTG
ncbi:MAG: alpha-ribazole phosphatase [Armatimonadaceae bacterium]